ncbi:hypothetical protein THAOC_19557, partial [Thalassiosira oceanica]
GLLVDDSVEHVVTVGSGPGAQRSAAGAASAPKFGGDAANADPCRRRRWASRTGTNGHNVFDTIRDD